MSPSVSRLAAACLLASGLAGLVPSSACAAAAPASAPASMPANAVRPAFGTPFNAAQTALKAGNAQEALAKLKEAEAVGSLTPYEAYVLGRLRGPALYSTGDYAGAQREMEASLSSPLLPAEDRLPITKVLATAYYQDKKYDQASDLMQKYLAAGGDDAQIRDLLPNSLYLAKKFPEAAKAYVALIDAQVAAGTTPDQKTLRILASAQNEAEDEAGYEKTIERLAVYYPSPEYWTQVLPTAKRADKFDDRLYVDYYRLRAAVLGQGADKDRLSYASQAARAGFPAEALGVLDVGMSRNAFTGADVAEAKKLHDTVARGAQTDRAQLAANETAARSAKDGEALVNLGVALAVDGQAEKGLGLIQQGIAKGGLKRPEDAKLHLGYVQWRAGHSEDALKTFQSVGGANGTASLAHVWMLAVQSGVKPAT